MRLALPLLATVLLGACSTTAKLESPQLKAQVARTKLYQVSWLSGVWRMEREEGFTQETWLPATSGMMFGIGFTTKNDLMRAYEYLRIETREDSLVYVAQPHGKSPGVEFYLSDLTADTALFENPDHDFPQWIRYERTGPESCVATIGGEAGLIEFHYECQP